MLTTAPLLIEEVITHHGVPRELLSDQGAAFLSLLLKEVYQLIGQPITRRIGGAVNRMLLSKMVGRTGMSRVSH